MKLFKSLAFAGLVASECTTVTVNTLTEYTTIWHFGDYLLGAENYQTDLKALFLAKVLDKTYTTIYTTALAGVDNFSLGDVTVVDLKANFPGDDCGLYCEKMNLLVTIPITQTTYVEVGDCDGSGDGETSMMARMGLDFVIPVIDVSIDEIEEVIEEELIEEETESEDLGLDDLVIEEGESDEAEETTLLDEDLNVIETNGSTGDDGELVCESGFTGEYCLQDVDECADNSGGCDFNCENVVGGFFCFENAAEPCQDGYSGTVPDCVDINECEDADICDANSTCDNSQGSYSCNCNSGFSAMDMGCMDINECASNPCVNAACSNSEGSYSCTCYDNFVNLPTGSADVCSQSSDYECFSGGNGGCSHFCSTTGCGCPTCWELESDGKTCVPAAENMSVTCSASTMSMNVHECVYGAGEDVTITLNSETCSTTRTDENWSVETALDGCGTSVDTVNDKIVFSNTLTVQSRAAAIVLFSDPEITFVCEYASSVQGVSTSLEVTSETHSADGSESTGSFDFSLQFVSPNAEGVFAVAENDVMIVGERVSFEVVNNNPISGVSFIVQECTVTDNDGKMHSVVGGLNLANNCLDPHTTAQRDSDAIATSSSRFSYIAFLFGGGSEESSSNLELTCSIAACLDADCADLVESCGARRRRRATAPASQIYSVSATGQFFDL